ncbi:MAG: hypothetical protein ABSG57_06500 [Candidatus Bathyarchaeia archaeon]
MTRMTTGNVGRKRKMSGIISGLTTIVVGIIITAVLWWLLGGFGFWELPGVAILFIGIGEVLYKIYVAGTDKRTPLLRGGILLMFIGLAGYVSFEGYFLFGTFQILSLIATVIGLVLLLAGFVSASKH